MTVTKITVSANQLSKREKAAKMKKIVSIIIVACVIVIFGYNEFGNKAFIFVGLMFVPSLFVWFFKKNSFFFENILKKFEPTIKKIALRATKHNRKRKDKNRKKWKEIYKQEQQRDNKNDNKT